MKVGLVLAGGGGKGAYQVGVMKALYELGFNRYIGAVSGTSVGALNGCLFLRNDIEAAEKMWLSISPDKILSIKSRSIIDGLGIKNNHSSSQRILRYAVFLEGYGIFSRKGLSEMIDESLDLQKISNSNIPFYASCIQVPRLTRTYFQLNGLDKKKITSILLATSAIPIVFPPEIIDGKLYIDGGIPMIGDNVPIEPLYEIGCDIIIVVPLERSYTIDLSRYSNAKVYEIIPQEYQGNIITGTLQFSRYHTKRRMEQGYNDAMRILQPVAKMLENELLFYGKSKAIVERDKNFMQQRDALNQTFEKNLKSLERKIKKGKWQ